MISKISGKLVEKKDSAVYLNVGGLTYEVLVPGIIFKELDGRLGKDGMLELVTYHYYQTDQSKSVPVLIGFLNEIEREFFESFITVSGIGPRAAVKALCMPISTIAHAISDGNLALLKTLPGIGEQRAREIVAKLQNKVGKYGLIQDGHALDLPAVEEDIKEEALSVLAQLQYKKTEAKQMIEDALRRNPAIKTPEEILNEVYRQRKTAR